MIPILILSFLQFTNTIHNIERDSSVRFNKHHGFFLFCFVSFVLFCFVLFCCCCFVVVVVVLFCCCCCFFVLFCFVFDTKMKKYFLFENYRCI